MSDKNTTGRGRRRFSRVNFNRLARLYLGGRWHEYAQIKNLSLGGVFIEGQYEADVGETCELELYENARSSSLVLTLTARVVRVDDDGLGLEFVDVEPNTYMFLQTIVLYHSDDPYDIALEFPGN
ncbi:hypothetical protein GF1_16570 [Desulfolithobacter dissulfuricans]|uniref:PilZ domain-containing protein n=1 Tax=Desulfolithobacter dissulfuricans TaxID=2795293 RepID=A0A915XL72_9BACT|nr:PilZ domain-containing protein [Desulfolithobacter dissulfuricans]BCO09281.1 hypothetical protein GF1_16570 [Desulfolithobacter dissulfuricans]